MNRALLLTDVVDSTKLAEQVGDVRMAEIWVAHDRAVRDLLPGWRGLEIDRTDGFLMLFDQVSDAVGFGAAVHAELARVAERFGVPFAARVGIHSGPVILIETSAADRALGAKPLEVEGLAKPLAARVMSVAAGGQTLLTGEARALLGPDVDAVSHGAWRMKGVTEPVELFELRTPGAPLTPPPDSAKVYRVVRSGDLWLPAREVRHNLPVERDAFFGREQDLLTLARTLGQGVRLVSVLGIGGTGKTRLVTRFAWTWLGDYPGGAWFCDLSEARSVEGIAGAVAAALDVPLGNDDPIVQLGHAIAGRGACLVVLDNFEQVTRHAATTVGKWLDRSSEARFVVTTREVLGLPGEHALALAPLRAEAAQALFVARASQAKRDFALTAAEQPHVEALVQLLDALPLAIELAAARVRVMPPKALLQRMSERFKLLSSSGGRHTRQATLRATLDWSWDLLSADEQSALAQLSVFEGGFTLAAAEEVLSLAELWPVDAVQALVDKSLVRQLSDDRLDLLVSVQEYAAERLDGLGSREAAESRHGAWYARLGEDEALDDLDRHGGIARRAALGSELDNLVAATRRAVARGDSAVAGQAARAAWAIFALRGPTDVGGALLDEVRAMSGIAPSLALRLDMDVARARTFLGRPDEARALYERALSALQEVAGAGAMLGRVLGNLGTLHLSAKRLDDAERCIRRAMRAHEEAGDAAGVAAQQCNLAALLTHLRRFDEAGELFEAALATFREVGDRRFEANVLGNLGLRAKLAGRLDEARALFEEAALAHRDVGNQRFEAYVVVNLAVLCRSTGDLAAALVGYERALAIARSVGDRPLELRVLAFGAEVLAVGGRVREARAWVEAALSDRVHPPERSCEAIALVALGEVARAEGRLVEAAECFRGALAIYDEIRSPGGAARCNEALAALESSA